MVDFKSYYQYGSTTSRIGETTVLEEIYDCHCSECSSNEVLRERFKPHYDNMTGKEDEEWEDLQIMLCPPRVFGYVLQDKQWAQLAVDSLGEIPDENLGNAMSGLYLEGEDNGKVTKDLLYGLVKNHGAGKAKKENKAYELDDIVAEKGKGLVILLYGAPGVGKTSTGMAGSSAVEVLDMLTFVSTNGCQSRTKATFSYQCSRYRYTGSTCGVKSAQNIRSCDNVEGYPFDVWKKPLQVIIYEDFINIF